MNEAKTPQSRSTRRYVIARTDEIVEGGRLIVQAGGREIGIYRVRGKFYALLNRCPHLGGPLCKGQVVTEVTAAVPGEVRGNPDRVFATCPWHNWEFDIATGQSYWNPKGLRARPFPVDVEMGEAVQEAMATGDAERIRGPYTAETIPIAVENEYLVLSLRPAPPAQRAAAADAPCAQPAPMVVAEENAR